MEAPHTFAGNPLDRGEALRRDEEAIDALMQEPNSRFLPFQALKVAAKDAAELTWLKRSELDNYAPSGTVFLGLDGDTPRFATTVEPTEDLEFHDCRAIAAALPNAQTGILAQARSQLDWHRKNPFCAQCGNPTRPGRGGQIRRCDHCESHIFPRTDPVAIMLIVDEPGGDRCLLGQPSRRGLGTNFYSALAGFIDQGESLEEAVRREVAEEAGIQVGPVTYHSSQPWPFPSQLMIGCHALALDHEINFDPVEMADVRWFDREEIKTALAEQHPGLRLPGRLAIAHHLIESWVNGEANL